ncbi:cellulase family glycosylhydrolase [Mycobacterium sp.]|uniref:cellulase family glycosylhydrolase n=1 Tax=Mycobacterium sp. TaxID=1785 RepID=UPI002DB2FBF0|nr:cellulase family glycosylhydrolase [Mycobacterium sp.]
MPTEPLPKPVNYEYVPTASIENTNNTIGVADSDIYGLTMPDGFTPDTAAMDKHLDELQALGVNTVRVLVPWAGNQPWPPGTLPPDWEATFWQRSDYLINAAAERGMGVLAVLNGTPAWGADPDEGGWGVGAAPDPEAFAAYAATVAQRYGVKISAYEIWNEPNAVPYWTPVPDPETYTEVLKAAWTAIKNANGIIGADPTDPLVVGGVLGAVVNFGDITMDPRHYLEQMYASGAKGYFDAISFHPYQYTTPFSEGEYSEAEPWKADSPLEQLIAMRQTMMINGDDALKIWATEYGLPTAGVNGVTEQQQADFIEDFLDAWDDLSYTGPAFIYTTVDRMDGTEDGSFGIFTKDAQGNWVPKLAAQVIKDAIAANQQQPDLGQAIGQALGQLFQQLFTTLAQSYVNAIAQALANLFAGIFNPAPAITATALSLPADIQAAVAEGTAAAAVSADTTVADQTATAADTAGVADAAPADVVAAEVVPAVEPEVTEPEVIEPEVTEPEVIEAVTEETAVEESEAPAEETETISEEPATEVDESAEATTPAEETSTEEATTPAGRKESDDEAKDEPKKESDKKSDEGTAAGGASSGGKHEAGSVKNGTSVSQIKDRLAKETVTTGAPAAAADASADAPAA